MAIEAIQFYGTREKVKAIHKEIRKEIIPSERTGRILPMRKIIRRSMVVAASALLIFIAIQGYHFYQLSPEALYRQSYIAYNVSATRGENIQVSQIEKFYAEKNYGSVTRLAKAETNLSDRERFLTGLSFLEMNDPGSAIVWFKTLNNQNNPYKQDAEFYLSLAYLLNKDYDHAVPLMQNISNDTAHIYHDRFSKKFIRNVKMLKWK